MRSTMRFERIRERYSGWFDYVLEHRGIVATVFGLFCVLSLSLAFVVGRDFFPYVDSGQMRLHVNAPAGHPNRRDGADIRSDRK